MRVYVDTKAVNSAGKTVRVTVSDTVKEINRKAKSRGRSAVNALQNAERHVLGEQGSGRVYRVPGTHGRASKLTRELSKDYGHKLRGGKLYRASAPGEPPARRTGNLRLHWNGQAASVITVGGIKIIAQLESQEPYVGYLENGTSKMAARPFVEKIKEEALPEIRKIYGEPYT